jgi:hypothetical protein
MGSQLGGDVRRYMGHLMTHLLGKHRMNAGMVLEWDDMVHVCVLCVVCPHIMQHTRTDLLIKTHLPQTHTQTHTHTRTHTDPPTRSLVFVLVYNYKATHTH